MECALDVQNTSYLSYERFLYVQFNSFVTVGITIKLHLHIVFCLISALFIVQLIADMNFGAKSSLTF